MQVTCKQNPDRRTFLEKLLCLSAAVIPSLPDATDVHHHIYDSRFPAAPGATLRPPDATVDDYRRLQKRIGITRHVAVQPSTYGTDNSCLLDALSRFGDAARGIAVVDTTVSNSELKRLDAARVRGLRFNLVQAGATSPEMVEPLARRIQALGWHIQVNAPTNRYWRVPACGTAFTCPWSLIISAMRRIRKALCSVYSAASCSKAKPGLKFLVLRLLAK